MKVLHIPFTYFPDSYGGTEVYVDTLILGLNKLGVESVVAAPAKVASEYTHHDYRVLRYAIDPNLKDLAAIYGTGDPVAEKSFIETILPVNPDLVHLHALTSGVSVRIARAVKQRGIPVVYSYHTPTASCVHGDLLYEGLTACPGYLNVDTCTHCIMKSKGLSPLMSQTLQWLGKVRLGDALGAAGISGSIVTGLKLHDLIATQHQAFREVCHLADHVFALCKWSMDVFERNGLLNSKVSLCRHGVNAWPEAAAAGKSALSEKDDRMKLIFLGRLEENKGISWLVNALRENPTVHCKLDIYGLATPDNPYATLLRSIARNDPRITIKPPLPREQIHQVYQASDLLMVPSRFMETGPLVVLEALAAGIPVAGSNLGGIPEWIDDGKNGFLVEPSAAGWTRFIRELPRYHSQLKGLRKNIQMPRTMEQVAMEIHEVYLSLLARP